MLGNIFIVLWNFKIIEKFGFQNIRIRKILLQVWCAVLNDFDLLLNQSAMKSRVVFIFGCFFLLLSSKGKYERFARHRKIKAEIDNDMRTIRFSEWEIMKQKVAKRWWKRNRQTFCLMASVTIAKEKKMGKQISCPWLDVFKGKHREKKNSKTENRRDKRTCWIHLWGVMNVNGCSWRLQENGLDWMKKMERRTNGWSQYLWKTDILYKNNDVCIFWKIW